VIFIVENLRISTFLWKYCACHLPE